MKTIKKSRSYATLQYSHHHDGDCSAVRVRAKTTQLSQPVLSSSAIFFFGPLGPLELPWSRPVRVR